VAVRDDELEQHVVEKLSVIGGIEAIALGGSRAVGTAGPDSDWDFGVYYRGTLNTQAIRDIGWPGNVFEPGDWGGGVFNGGAWLQVDGSKVDLIYRDLHDVERRIADAEVGRFSREYLSFYIAGIPTYVVVGELSCNRLLFGNLPRPAYPDALSKVAAERWHENAVMSLEFGRKAYVARADAVGAAGMLTRAIFEEAHSRLAARKEWVLNEKRLAERAGFANLFPTLGHLGQTADELSEAFDVVESALLG
jgi:hypothetical protein